MSTPEALRRLERLLRDPIVGDGVLRPGHFSPACDNIRTVLRSLGYAVPPGQRFDESLRAAVLGFQTKHKHSSLDGYVGPGTRKLLVQAAIAAGLQHIFDRMPDPDTRRMATVFLSYAWADSDKVDKLDQWLLDHGVQVLRDDRDFIPGKQLGDEIARAIEASDKVVVIYSKHSKTRDWPAFERQLAERKEASGATGLLVYVMIDDTPPPKHDPNRIYVVAATRPLTDIGRDLLRAIRGDREYSRRVKYDARQPL